MLTRKSAPKVKRGRVQKKNRWDQSPNYYTHSEPWPVIDRQRPGRGRHLLHQSHVQRFLRLLPEWDELASGLNAIVLTPFDDCMGYHVPGVVHICAWERDLWWNDAIAEFIADHREILDRLGVAVVRQGRLVVKWTEPQARAFQLMHVLLHELGHHHDRMTNRSGQSARGEPFAESYAARNADRIWERYCIEFEDP